MSIRDLIATVVGILAAAAVLLGILAAVYTTGEHNRLKDQQYITDCTAGGGSVINGQCLNFRDLAPRPS